jgi:hypothetical protein
MKPIKKYISLINIKIFLSKMTNVKLRGKKVTN